MVDMVRRGVGEEDNRHFPALMCAGLLQEKEEEDSQSKGVNHRPPKAWLASRLLERAFTDAPTDLSRQTVAPAERDQTRWSTVKRVVCLNDDAEPLPI